MNNISVISGASYGIVNDESNPLTQDAHVEKGVKRQSASLVGEPVIGKDSVKYKH
jgi:hypothetical protein